MKQLIIFSGLPGSGKSTLSKMYCEKHGAFWLSVDPIEGILKINGVTDVNNLGIISYGTLSAIADENLSIGASVVIDAVNPIEEARQIWRSLAHKHNLNLKIIECVVVDKEIHKKRIETRIRNIPGYSEITWSDVLKREEEYITWLDKRLVVETDGFTEESLDKIESYLS